LGDVVSAAAAGSVGRIGADMNVEIDGTGEKLVDDSVLVSHVSLLARIVSVFIARRMASFDHFFAENMLPDDRRG
jgi:hypothetical protein